MVVSVTSKLLEELADDLFHKLIHTRITNKNSDKWAIAVGRFYLAGQEEFEVMTTIFSDYLDGDISDGKITIKLDDGIRMHNHAFLMPIYIASISKVSIDLGVPGTDVYKKNLALCLKTKQISHAKFFINAPPLEGIPELKPIFKQLEILQCPIRMIPSGVKDAFPNLLNLTTASSVPAILNFFNDAGVLPNLKYFCINLSGNMETFFNEFVCARLPELKVMVLNGTHYGNSTFDSVELYASFANGFPILHSAVGVIIQTHVKFNNDLDYYIDLHNRFAQIATSSIVTLQLQHTIDVDEDAPLPAIDYQVVKHLLQPLGYDINPDYSGYCKRVTAESNSMVHHILVELPPPVRVKGNLKKVK